MIDLKFFERHQKILVWLANTWLGRLIFQFEKMGHKPTKYGKIIKITPQSIVHSQGLVWDKKTKNLQELKTEQFFSRYEYALKLRPWLFWLPSVAWETDKGLAILRPALACFLIFFAKEFLPFLALTTDTFNPVAGANSPCDGYVRRDGVDEAFATIRAGAGVTAGVSNTFDNIARLQSSATSNQYNVMLRGFFLFNTATIDNAAVISSAFLSLRGRSVGQEFAGALSLHVAAATPAATDNLATGDYGNIGRTSFASMAYGDYITNGYNQFDFNASGIANISLTGVSKFSTQTSWDINNSGPTWSANKQGYFTANFADNGTEKPILSVTYTTPVAWTQALAETIGLTDALAKTINKNTADSSNLTDSLIKTNGKNLADNSTLADVLVKDNTKALAETLVLSDILQKTGSLNLTESLLVAESLILTVGKNPTDSISISDSLAETIGKVLSDNLGLSDAIQKIIQAYLTENVALADSFIGSLILNKDLADLTNLQDGLSMQIGKYTDDSLILSDALDFLKTFYRDLAEQINLSDSVQSTVAKELTENVALADAQIFTTEKIVSDLVILADAVRAGIEKAISDNTNLSDDVIKALTLGQIIDDQILVVEALRADVGKAIDDNITISDLINASVGFTVSLSDQIDVAERLVKEYNLGLREALALADSLSHLKIERINNKTIIPKNHDKIVIVNDKKDKVILVTKL
ncbi:MAG: hypothetical protein WC737_05710 [Parcubacteria group bacterium]|jgi:hypothetical protein